MTLDELAASLPNGFHDAELSALTIDYTKSEARLVLDVWIGDMGAKPDGEREAYRLAELALSGLLFWVSEPPHADYPYDIASGLKIDIGPLERCDGKDRAKLPPIPVGAFENWVFVDDWNAFAYVAAKDASLKWLSDKTIRHYPAPRPGA